jgi:hypothetical protein
MVVQGEFLLVAGGCLLWRKGAPQFVTADAFQAPVAAAWRA